VTRSAGGKKFKATIRLRPKIKPVLHRVPNEPDPIASRPARAEAKNRPFRTLSSSKPRQ
jgi:hypothetical protein